MNIVIPMAGRGSRFALAGLATPKPLIDVLGKPMYAWAVESMPLALAKRLIFICLKEHLEAFPLEADIQSRYAEYAPVVIALDEVTEGQASTVLLAREHFVQDAPLMIFNADTYCRTDLQHTLPEMPGSVAGMLGVFRAEGDRWSFARTDAEGRVVETSEKVRISDLACTGLYYFSSASQFCEYADRMIRENLRVKNEFYVAPVYNLMIGDGLDIRLNIAEEAWALGTPEDLNAFLAAAGTAKADSSPGEATARK